MGISPERNDIDIKKLFQWGKEITIEDRTGKELFKCYLRLVGDADVNRARVFALRQSAQMRRQLKTKDSEYRTAYIVEPEDIEEDRIKEMIVYMSMRDITYRSIQAVDIPLPKEPPDNATLEQQEKFQEEIDNWPVLKEKKVKEYIDNEVTKLRKELDKRTKEQLHRQYEETVINEICETEMSTKYREFCVFQGLYKDASCAEKLFSEFETFDNLPTEIKELFLLEYSNLEIPVDELKK